MSYILALDEGTTSARAMVFDHEGRIRSAAHRAIELAYPQPGWVELDPQEIWSTQIGVAVEALERASLSARDVAAIGIANQRETTVIWDRRTGQPIRPAIVWQDRRTAAMCNRLRADGCEELIVRRTGLLLDPYFSATKLAWLLEHVPGARQRAERGELAAGTVDSWLVWKFTGGERHVTDASNASRMMLLDLRTGEWDEELLDLFGIPRGLLPQVVASSGGGGPWPPCCAPPTFARLRCRITGTGGHSNCRHRRRSAGGAVRTDVRCTRHDEKHVRHRLLCAASHG